MDKNGERILAMFVLPENKASDAEPITVADFRTVGL